MHIILHGLSEFLKSFLGTTPGKVTGAAAVLTIGATSWIGIHKANPSPQEFITSSDTKDYEFDLNYLSSSEKQNILSKKVSPHFHVSDFMQDPVSTIDGKANQNLVVRHSMLVMLERLIVAVQKTDPKAQLIIVNGFRGAAKDNFVGGNGFGPHARGDAVDVTFKMHNAAYTREIARFIAATADDLGVNGIAIDQEEDVDHPEAGIQYVVHLDPVRPDKWHVEQEWKSAAVSDTGRSQWVPVYRRVNAQDWKSAAPAQNPYDVHISYTGQDMYLDGKKVLEPSGPRGGHNFISGKNTSSGNPRVTAVNGHATAASSSNFYKWLATQPGEYFIEGGRFTEPYYHEPAVGFDYLHPPL